MEDPLLLLQYGSDRRQHREEGRKEGRCRQFVQLHITANAQITFCDNASCSSASASVDRGGAGASAWPAAGHLIRVGLSMYNHSDGAEAASGKIYRYSTPLFDKKQVLFYRLCELSITLVKADRSGSGQAE